MTKKFTSKENVKLFMFSLFLIILVCSNVFYHLGIAIGAFIRVLLGL